MQRRIKSPSSAVLICSFLAAVLLSEPRPLSRGLVGARAAQAQPEATLSGVITDAFGGQLSDATLRLYSADRVLQTRSDEKGGFRFARVPPGTYQLEAARPGFKIKRITAIQVSGKDEPLPIILDVANTGGCLGEDSVSYASAVDGMTLMGVVLDSERPVAGAKIDLVSASGARAVASGQSNGKGEFQFTNLEPGQYVLRVSHPEHQAETTESFWVARETTTKVVTRILKRGSIRVCE